VNGSLRRLTGTEGGFDPNVGRWPANVVIDEGAAAMLDEQTGELGASGKASGPTYAGPSKSGAMSSGFGGMAEREPVFYGDSGGASRFFYTAKAARDERGEDNTHPTVKPVSLMRWLVRMVTPPGGLVLDPFNGSGSTGVASIAEGCRYVGCEREAEYVEISRRRLADAEESQRSLF
jgi:site-specific DNA-methyltransferase (adenine-specific)